MVLYLVDELARMLQTHSNGKGLSLNLYPGICKITIYVACGMSCSKNDRPVKLFSICRADTHDSATIRRK